MRMAFAGDYAGPAAAIAAASAPPDIDSRAVAWDAAQRLLVVRLDDLGDLLMTTPALAALRRGLPRAHIALLTSPSGARLAPHLSDIDEAIVHDASWMADATQASPAAERALVDMLAARRFDAAVVFTVCTQSALPAATLLRLAGIPLRLAHARENPHGLLTDWACETDLDLATARHEVRRQLDLVAGVGFTADDERLRFALKPEDVRRVGDLLYRAGVEAQRPLVVVHPGAAASSRRYPPERFGIAAQRIVEQAGAVVVFTGSADEAPFIEAARTMMKAPSLSLAGRLSLGELAALVARAAALVSNDSGPVHLAAALATPVVDLYAHTSPQHTPWLVSARVLDQDAAHGHPEGLHGVPAQAVADAALDLIGSRAA